jgi:hypothetical protein
MSSGCSDESWVSAGDGAGGSEASMVLNVMRNVQIHGFRHERARGFVDGLWRCWWGCRGSSLVDRWAMVV